MTYATPEAFRQALEARIRRAARERGQAIARVRQLLVFDRFLARAVAVLGDRVIVKGGAVLELRLVGARTTRDIDLSVSGNPDELLATLQRAAALDLGDHFSFVFDVDTKHPEIVGEGLLYTGRRYRAEARIGDKICGDSFGVDVAFGDKLTTRPDILDGTDFFAFINIPRTRYRVYPRETHVAEKLHAYTLPRTRENSRVKDLPDLALLAMTGPFEAAALRLAVDSTFAVRRTHPMPASLPTPPSFWAPKYAEIARRDQLRWADLPSALAAARAFLDPLLAGVEGRWEPDSWAWMTS